jgi:diaminohydroxyphosphoribosylaminopyrimidine deaminase/5-amino-6-(5-phosphoribosylamino)uracil reductase
VTHALEHVEAMRRAIDEARLAVPSPNPPVGAVVISAEGELLAAAHHKRAGAPHAEVEALAIAGPEAKGASLYVTLEPCNHHGRTPPCVDAILAAGIRRVFIGARDPNPHVDGGGIERLESAGVEVVLGVAGDEAKALIEPWSTYILTGMPHVSLKLALSLDGRIATRTGASRWVTGPEARSKVQELRAQSDAIVIGIGTALADDPLLTVRDPAFEGRAPRRVVFDSGLRLPADSKLVRSSGDAPVLVITTLEASADAEHALLAQGVEVLRVASTAEGRIDVEAAMRQLASLGVVMALVEGGAELAGTLLAARLVHRMHAFVAPVLLGPRGRPGAVDWAGPDTPAEAPRIADPQWECVGRDAYVWGRVEFPTRTG